MRRSPPSPPPLPPRASSPPLPPAEPSHPSAEVVVAVDFVLVQGPLCGGKSGEDSPVHGHRAGDGWGEAFVERFVPFRGGLFCAVDDPRIDPFRRVHVVPLVENKNEKSINVNVKKNQNEN